MAKPPRPRPQLQRRCNHQSLLDEYPQEAGILARAGLRPTLSHVKVLKVLLCDRRRWLDGEGIYRLLLAQPMPASLPSVYRSLKTLERHDLLLRKWTHGVTGGKASYILNDGNASVPRYDVICRHCGTSLSLQDSAMVEHIRQFTMNNAQICHHQPATLQITCSRCDDLRAYR